jgi:hypothetical protein
MHRLEVNGEIEIGYQDRGHQEEHIGRCGPNNAMLQHREWDHGSVSLSVFPEEKQHERGRGTDKEANDHRAVPGKLVATIL